MVKKKSREKVITQKDEKKAENTSEKNNDVEKSISEACGDVKKYFGLLIAGLVIGLLAGLALMGPICSQTDKDSVSSQTLTAEEAGQKAIDFINNNLIQQGEAVLTSVEEKNGLYFINTTYQENEIPIYVTKDGEVLFVQGNINMEEFAAMKMEAEKQQEQNQEQEQKLEIPKTERPDVKLFIMTYCPYGLQAEKAYLPVYNLLKDKADMTINFVSYAMHDKKEIDENLRHYCIQLEQEDKFYDYASCFAGGDGNYTKCLEEAEIDKTKLSLCMNRTNEEFNITGMYNDKSTWSGGRFPMFNVEVELNEKYSVRGSPTFVINDQVVSVNRSPEAIKEAVCSSFINPPEECNQKLSEDAASPGFGGGVGNSSAGKC